jgi:hypothetical protein
MSEPNRRYCYYIAYLFINSADRASAGHGYSFTYRNMPIRTEVDLRGVIASLEADPGFAPKSITILNWIELEAVQPPVTN